MTLISVIPQRELAYQANLAFEGETFKLFLALNPGALTAEDDVADWEAEECSGGGYAAATGTISTGAWNSTANRHEPPVLTITGTATGAGFSFDAIITKVGSRTHCANVLLLPGVKVLAAGQPYTYEVQLTQSR